MRIRGRVALTTTAGALALGALGVLAGSAQAADIIYGTTGRTLVRFNATTPGTIDQTLSIRGLPPGVQIVGLDERPSTLQLYGEGSDGILYLIGKSTGLAFQVGGAIAPLPTGAVGIDFNPLPDRLRLVTSDERNVRINPVTGALAGSDTALSPEGNVVAIAYDRTVYGAGTATTLFALDSGSDRLLRIGSADGAPFSPNSGLIADVGPLGFDATGASDLDIAASGTAYASLTPAAGGSPVLATVDLTTGAATPVGAIGGVPVTDIAAADPPRIGYSGFASPTFLIRFPLDVPKVGAAVGFPVPDSGTIHSMDFRPASGRLLGLTETGGVYDIDTTNANVTATPAVAPTIANDAGFDVNPVADRVRVTADSDQNARLNPFTAPFATSLDTNLAYVPGDVNAGADPSVTAVAYTNSFPGATTTSLFAVDQATDTVDQITNPNGGSLTTIAPLGLDAGTPSGFDIPAGGTAGYLLTKVGGVGNMKLLRVLTDGTIGSATRAMEVGEPGLAGGTSTLLGLAIAPVGVVTLPATATTAEGIGAAQLTITRSAGDAGPANVEYEITPGSASAGSDFDPAGGTVSFADGQTTATISVPITDDTTPENAETFTVTLKRPGGGLLLGSAASTVVTLLSDDAPPATTVTVPVPGPTVTTTETKVVPAADTTKPVALIAFGAPTKLATLRVTGLGFRLLVGEAAKATAGATVDARTKAKLKLTSATVVTPATVVFPAGQARTVRLKLTAAAKKKLATVRSVVLTVTATVVDSAGNRTVTTQKVTVRR